MESLEVLRAFNQLSAEDKRKAAKERSGGDTILSAASRIGDVEIVTYLLDDCEVDVDQMGTAVIELGDGGREQDAPPLFFAAEYHHLQVVKVLLSHGCSEPA